MKRAFAMLLLAAMIGASPASAQEDSVAIQKRRELEDIQRQAREKREAASRLKGQENRALSQLKRTERRLNLSRRRLDDLQRRRQRLDSQLDMTRGDLQRNLGLLADQRDRLGKRLRALYKFGPARELEFLLSTQSFGQLLARWDYLVLVAQQDRFLLEGVRDRKEVVETLERRLQSHLTQVQRTANATTSENRRLAVQREAKRSAIQQIQTQREAYEAAAADLERTAQQLRSLLSRLEQKRQSTKPYSGDFAKGQGALEWPVQGDVVGRFGPEHNPRFPKVVITNNGMDIAAPIGSPVRAVAKGRVDYTSEDYGAFGQMIIVNHGDSYYTLYGHLSDISVSVGQEVSSGQVIARSGDTGSLKGPILHFEVRRGGTALNPQTWLR
ncbi:MAG TPA: peptidoglycan DD-metalloendopeptidase family protein [Candidatus Eisenbacteria bacterium]|nr:peptidoglycan DD-metalloendopeptidase family protein [Candidatus Eisenbacteria bacterium]